MRYNTWTFLPILSLISNIACKSLPIANNFPEATVASDPYYIDELEQLKQNLRNLASSKTVYTTMPLLNKTIEEKRQMLRQMREKLRELKDLDESQDYHHNNIHTRDLHSYTSTGT